MIISLTGNNLKEIFKEKIVILCQKLILFPYKFNEIAKSDTTFAEKHKIMFHVEHKN